METQRERRKRKRKEGWENLFVMWEKGVIYIDYHKDILFLDMRISKLL